MVQSSKKYIKAKCPLRLHRLTAAETGCGAPPQGSVSPPGGFQKMSLPDVKPVPCKLHGCSRLNRGSHSGEWGLAPPESPPWLTHPEPQPLSLTPRDLRGSASTSRGTLFSSPCSRVLFRLKTKKKQSLACWAACKRLGPVRRNNALDAAIAKPSYIKIRRPVV